MTNRFRTYRPNAYRMAGWAAMYMLALGDPLIAVVLLGIWSME